MSLIGHRRSTLYLCEETEMQKWARMLVETGKSFVGPSAMLTQMRENSDFWSLPTLTILCCRTLWSSQSIQKMDLAQPKWTTPQPDWLHSSEEALPIRREHRQNMQFSTSKHWKWPRLANDDLQRSSVKNQQAKADKTQVWPRKANFYFTGPVAFILPKPLSSICCVSCS